MTLRARRPPSPRPFDRARPVSASRRARAPRGPAILLGARERGGADRLLHVAAAVLAFSVLTDSALEHYRGGFRNRAMVLGPAAAAATLWTAVRASLGYTRLRATQAIYAAAVVAGAVGTAFHVFNVGKRPGGFSWENLFYAAPLGAPGALAAAGALGWTARSGAASRRNVHAPDISKARWVVLVSAAGLLAGSAEAALLHFRGAFHNRVMFFPVTLPPLTAAALAHAALNDTPARRRRAGALLTATAALGVVGAGFHAYGVHRRMGGWRNWSQNLLQGPPLPAPLGFTGMALAGLAALALLRERRR